MTEDFSIEPNDPPEKGERRRDDGFALVFFALALVAIMGIAALVVDLGAWYLKADKIQRAADAAALAGVVFMPGDPGTALSTAENTAVKNGFPASEVSVQTSLNDTALNKHELLVTIKDPAVPTFFAKVFGIDSIAETRSSVAEYQPPVPLGSAENSFGTGGLDLGVGNPTNIWAAVNGYCTSKENGDEFLSAFDATFTGSSYECSDAHTAQTPNATANWEYNGADGTTAGYSYDIVTPSDGLGVTSAPIQVEAYDPAYEPTQCAGQSGPFNPAGGETVDNGIGQSGTAITTDFHLTYEPVPLDPSLDTAVPGLSVGSTSAPSDDGSTNEYVAASADPASCGQWVNLFTIPAGSVDGDYRLQVTTPQSPGQLSDGTNAYGLRVYEGATGTWTRCSTITSDAWYSPDCPVIQGLNALSVYAYETTATTGQFYLAQIDPSYAGHNLEVTLFDPGEGDKDMKLIDPDGNAVSFFWQTTDDCGANPPTPFTPPPSSAECAEDLGFSHLSDTTQPAPTACTDCIEVDGTINPPPGIASDSIFNDRHVTLAFSIPSTYTGDNGGWWKIQYDSNNNVTDRTTWTISLSGSPIHLVPDPG